MKHYFALFLLLTITELSWSQNLYVSQQVSSSFFSEAPIEDISAHSEQGESTLNLSTKAVYFKINIRSFEFKKRLMQQHFNENYMESDKYPYAELKGMIMENIDPHQEGTFPVTVQGKLSIHGVTKDYTVNGEINVLKDKITANARFPVKLVDHKIKIPRIVIKNIAEVVAVQISAIYTPSTKSSQ